MRACRLMIAICCCVAGTGSLEAGIHIRGEKLRPNVPPNQPAEFWQQLQFLRSYGPTDAALGGKPTQQRLDFLAKVEKLKRLGRLGSDEQADLGGYLLYLKQTTPQHPPFEEAVGVLEAGYRANPRHFTLAANLGTAYQLTGRLDAAERCLDAAVELANVEQRPLEQLQLTLVRRRMRENFTRGQYPDLDLIFGRLSAPFRFVGEQGTWNYGQLAASEVEKLPEHSPATAAAQVQQLLVWLPDDGRLIWQLAEWALVLGQKKPALMLYDQAVNSFRLSHPELKQHRVRLQEALIWESLLAQVQTQGRGEPWMVRVLGQSLGCVAPLGSPGASVSWLGSALPARKSAQDLLSSVFNESDVGNQPPVVTGHPFVMQTWHWALIGIGVALALAMVVWQVQQLRKPRHGFRGLR